MKKCTKSDLDEFAKLAAEGRGFLIPLHYPFQLPGQVSAREIPFMGGLELTERWARELQGGDEQLKADFEHDQKTAQRVMKTLLTLVQGSLSAEAAKSELKAAGKLGRDWAEPDMITGLATEKPEIRELLQHLLQFGQLRLAALEKSVANLERVVNSITELGIRALDHRDAYAAEQIANIANYSVTILESLAEQRADLVRPLARKSYQWPVLADVDPDWQSHASIRLRKLQLGEDTIHGKFDKAKAYSLENISRRYARGIVETLEKNRCCAVLVEHRMAIMRAKEKRDGIKVIIDRIPAWFKKAAQLAPFGPSSADQWLDVGIEMLKQQCPNLPKSTDWQRIKKHWENRGDRQTPGRMWGSIKDALRSPMKTIARGHQPGTSTAKAARNLGYPNSASKKA